VSIQGNGRTTPSFSPFSILPAENFMKVKVQAIGILEEEIPPPWQGTGGEISFESPVSLHYLLTEFLKIRDTDKVVLVNGKYRTPIYELQDGDEIQIFPRLDGG
jgi:hypothetical protein